MVIRIIATWLKSVWEILDFFIKSAFLRAEKDIPKIDGICEAIAHSGTEIWGPQDSTNWNGGVLSCSTLFLLSLYP